MGASAVATTADVVSLLVLVHGAHVPSGAAAVAACVVGGAVNFALCRAWLRGGARARSSVAAQAVLYGLLVVLGGGLWSGLLVQAAAEHGVPLLGAKALAALVVLVGWNYPISVRVFRARTPEEERGHVAFPVPVPVAVAVDRDPRVQRG